MRTLSAKAAATRNPTMSVMDRSRPHEPTREGARSSDNPHFFMQRRSGYCPAGRAFRSASVWASISLVIWPLDSEAIIFRLMPLMSGKDGSLSSPGISLFTTAEPAGSAAVSPAGVLRSKPAEGLGVVCEGGASAVAVVCAPAIWVTPDNISATAISRIFDPQESPERLNGDTRIFPSLWTDPPLKSHFILERIAFSLREEALFLKRSATGPACQAAGTASNLTGL